MTTMETNKIADALSVAGFSHTSAPYSPHSDMVDEPAQWYVTVSHTAFKAPFIMVYTAARPPDLDQVIYSMLWEAYLVWRTMGSAGFCATSERSLNSRQALWDYLSYEEAADFLRRTGLQFKDLEDLFDAQ